ncbi:ATP-binding protein [Ferrimonas aestuarii]|uniref:histidine kinase n=1 Tax=Ferrimonas aestuarii TaxID=2569539 RepID=A0A4U1BKL6_9GAMM|nr:ATP-binding protein [Ferrimonas aestuarii]TKB51766.1 HAMP domain-containing protein [Ferrimonas aestuarii]
MARLTQALPNRLFIKLLLAFWITSSVIAGGLILLPKLQQMDDVERINKPQLQMLSRTAMRLEQLPVVDVNRFANRLRKELRKHEHQRDPRDREQVPLPRDFDDRFRLYLLTPDGQLMGKRHDRQPHSVRKFLFKVDDFSKPMSVRTREGSIFGPEPLTLAGKPYLLLMEVRQPHRRGWIAFLVENPLWFLGLTALVSGCIFGFVAWHFGRPLNQLRQTADELAQGNLDARVDPKVTKRTDEVGQLAKTFDTMADSVSHLIKDQQRLLSDISHELRTPLTRIQLSLALARRKGQQSQELDRLEQQADQMEKMIHELLQLSRLSTQAQEQQQPMQLDECLQTVIEGAQFEAEQQQKQLFSDIQPQLKLVGNATLLSRAVENLLRNAIRYSDQRIQLKVYRHQQQLLIQVDDDGEGVPESELQQIFKPFKRISEARDRQSGGWGLGLAIVQAAASAHRGHVEASRSQLGGLNVTLTLPLS